MTLRTLSFAGAFVLAATLVAQAADITGKWTAQVPGRDGQTRETTFNFKVDGEKLTVTMTGPQGDIALQDGKVAGDQISFTTTLEFGGNSIKLLYKGTVSGTSNTSPAIVDQIMIFASVRSVAGLMT